MNSLTKFAHLYDKIDCQPENELISGITTGVAVARRSDLRSAGNL